MTLDELRSTARLLAAQGHVVVAAKALVDYGLTAASMQRLHDAVGALRAIERPGTDPAAPAAARASRVVRTRLLGLGPEPIEVDADWSQSPRQDGEPAGYRLEFWIEPPAALVDGLLDGKLLEVEALGWSLRFWAQIRGLSDPIGAGYRVELVTTGRPL